MDNSLLNTSRPPVFCPGCSHERVVYALDKALAGMGLSGDQIVIVSDIGCSGLFDTFFHTHALHGLHGRALTYAAGLKLASPGLTVIVVMGDGGMGIGGAHFLSACRRNLDLTLLILNNFNIGMTGGQFSVTTPSHADTASGFLNRLEIPLDICQIAAAAGAPYVARLSAYQNSLFREIENAVRFEGFSALDIRGICTGRYTRKNRLTPEIIQADIDALPKYEGVIPQNLRKEYGSHYRESAKSLPSADAPAPVLKKFDLTDAKRQEILFLGGAGQKIITAGEILCIAGMTAGLNASLKNEHNITVLRGPSVSEVILSPEEIDFTGILKPDIIFALDQEGVLRRESLFKNVAPDACIIQAAHVTVPNHQGTRHQIDFRAKRIKASDAALAALIFLSGINAVISPDMLKDAFQMRFGGKALQRVMGMFDQLSRVI